MTETMMSGPEAGLSPAELAALHGLRVSGARPGLVAYTRELWSRRHFIVAFANARLAATYTNARLGQLWQVLTPLVNAGVYYLIFGVLLNTKHGIDNFIAYLCTGIFIFNFTQQAVLSGTKAIAGNLGLIRALHFPRACLPIAFTLTQLRQLVYSIGVLLAIVLITGERPTFAWLLVVPVLLLQSIFNAGLAMLMARIGAKSTDLSQLMPFVMRTWMYVSGVFYSVAAFAVHAPNLVAMVLRANPLLVYIDLTRYALIDSVPLASPPAHLWLLGLGWAVLIGGAGYVYFWLGEEEYGRG
jgi:teichoic acid transport system permease protein